MRIVRWLLVVLAVLALAGFGKLVTQRYDYPDLSAYRSARLSAGTAKPGDVVVTYAGVSTLLFSDGFTSIMIDGFFSRPGLLRVALTRLKPDQARIDTGMAAMGAESLAAVVCVHSHYDHCMDAPSVALASGADLLGSESTAWIGRGMELPENRIRVAPYGTSYEYGEFTLTFYESRHVPLSWNASLIGVGITTPLAPPARASAYLEGGSYSVLIEHPNGNALVQGSAGYLDGALDDVDVDVLFLGIGALGTKDDAYIDGYWNALVAATTPERLIPIHFEDFTWPIAPTQRPMPAVTDDLGRTFDTLVKRTDADPKMDFALMPYLEPVVLFPASERGREIENTKSE